MKTFLTIINGKITYSRQDTRDIKLEHEVEDDGTYGNVGDILIDGVWKPDPLSVAEQAKQQRITELKTLIDNKRYLGDDVTAEQTELRELLGL